MDLRFSSKRELYYEKAMKLFFKEGLGVTQISRALPLSRAILYKWIAIFAEENPQMASMRRVKEAKKVSIPSSEAQEEELPKNVLELQAELKRLRAQLKRTEIKAEAYDELINVAEAKFNIPIRKKAGAKQ
ncbi:MAG: transposase [Bacteroidales bacterium]|nr:transposase [Bacteroidales bacterium]